ncbi:hypothetical protein HUJ04_000112 [Dendroctonus ponderosae]|nr:hypothetical protein HUJ04_000112 [Dendroctonus ponderosae]KAH1003225.1 hypothetical protein HUJ05_011158 [Dendroctonus ponderosae]
MSALSLPRVLHPRKTSLEIEREVFEKAQGGPIRLALSAVSDKIAGDSMAILSASR